MGLIFKSPIFSYKSGQIKNFLKFFQKSLDKRKSLCYTIRAQIRRKVSSVGRASALQAEGHRFEPCTFHQRKIEAKSFSPHKAGSVFSKQYKNGLVAQLVRALACHARGRGFEPHPSRHSYASVAQLVEQRTENPRVVGSIPTGGTICGFSSFGRAPPCQGGGGGFEPRNPLQTKSRAFWLCFFVLVAERGIEAHQ